MPPTPPTSPTPPPQRAAGLIFTSAVLVLLTAEVLRPYWIMPFPSSQQGDTLAAAYALHRSLGAVRILLGGAALWAAARLLARGRWRTRGLTLLGLAAIGFVVYETHGPLSADVMFRPPTHLTFATAGRGAVAPVALVVGIALVDTTGRTQARAYPIQLIGYHHQVRDEVAGQPVMVTYCTVCRTGRVFRPVVDGTARNPCGGGSGGGAPDSLRPNSPPCIFSRWRTRSSESWLYEAFRRPDLASRSGC